MDGTMGTSHAVHEHSSSSVVYGNELYSSVTTFNIVCVFYSNAVCPLGLSLFLSYIWCIILNAGCYLVSSSWVWKIVLKFECTVSEHCSSWWGNNLLMSHKPHFVMPVIASFFNLCKVSAGDSPSNMPSITGCCITFSPCIKIFCKFSLFHFQHMLFWNVLLIVIPFSCKRYDSEVDHGFTKYLWSLRYVSFVHCVHKSLTRGLPYML